MWICEVTLYSGVVIMAGIFAVAIVAIVLSFVYIIVKMSLEYAERMEKIKRGYPLEDERSNVIDHRDSFGNDRKQSYH